MLNEEKRCIRVYKIATMQGAVMTIEANDMQSALILSYIAFRQRRQERREALRRLVADASYVGAVILNIERDELLALLDAADKLEKVRDENMDLRNYRATDAYRAGLEEAARLIANYNGPICYGDLATKAFCPCVMADAIQALKEKK